MARDLTTVILDSAIQLSSARVHGDPISDHPPHCLHAMTVQAKAIENGAERLWIQAADPWNRPRVFVRDGNGGLLPVTLTPEGREAVPAAERRMVLRIGSDGVYEFDVAHWSGACAEDDPVEAMRSFARNPLPLCHNHRG
jgi:hypothetical protein